MEEILHHLGWLKPYNEWDKPSINWCRISSIHHMTLTLSHQFFEVHAEACGNYFTGNLRYPPTKASESTYVHVYCNMFDSFPRLKPPNSIPIHSVSPRTTELARISEKDPLLAPEGRLRSWICRSSSSTKSKFFRGKSATCITKAETAWRCGATMTWLSGDYRTHEFPRWSGKELGIMEVKKQHKYGRIDLDAHGDGIRFSMPFPSFRNHFENLRLKRNSKNPCSQKTTVSHNLFLVGGIPTPLKKYESQLRWVFPIYGKVIQMFQTTNQIYSIYVYIHGLVISLTFTFPNIENKLSTVRLSGNLGKF